MRAPRAFPASRESPGRDRGYVSTREIGKRGLSSRLYAAGKADLAQRPYVRAFIELLKDRSFQLLPGLSRL